MIRGAVAVVATSLALAGCGGKSAGAPPKPAPAPATTSVTATAPAAKPRHRPRHTPNPGSLPQTHQLPSADTPRFHAEMQALWTGVQRDSPAAARPAFFPKGAYVQVKAIGDPKGDYTGRLLTEYRLDLAAAHELLSREPQSAHLVGVHVPTGYAHWVQPGVCDNRVGYYELPNARVVYRQNGAVHSFGIASMISWRGVWYVVHLGAVTRPTAGGAVDDPSPGVGASAPSSTC